MKIELGKWYVTRDEMHFVRIISLIGKWCKKRPIVGECHLMRGRKKIVDEGLFDKYEHWMKDGRYLSDKSDSAFDLVREHDEDETAPKI